VLEVVWTVLPVVFLAIALAHSLGALYGIEGVHGTVTDVVSVIGHQWYWEYNGTDSRMIGSRMLGLGGLRLGSVDQALYVHSGNMTGLGVSSVDVIHSYSVPGLGLKLDGIPGRVSCSTV
jgi:heme/copper-type cytochrome/quinol oxidase subunit 2